MSEKEAEYIYLNDHSFEKTWSFIKSWDEVLAWLKDGSIQSGDYIIEIKRVYKARSETNILLESDRNG